MTTPAAPQSATPPAPADGQPPAATPPVPGPPPNAPAPQGNRDWTATPAKPADAPAADAPKTFTQAELDQYAAKARAAERAQWAKKVQGVFGEGTPDDPAAALKQAQERTATFQQQAQTAMAESLAVQAGIKPERVEMFVRLVDLSGALNGVDPTDLAAVRGAIKTAVDTTAAGLPEFKASAGLPAASGGDRQGVGQPSLDEQIATAVKNGDHAAAIALKRQKLYQTG